MTDNAKKFVEKVSGDEALKAELTEAVKGLENAEQIPAVIAFAKKHGFELTKEDFVEEKQELSLDELETVTGGGACACPIIGGGGGDGLKCACGLGGHGDIDEEGAGMSQGGCVCIVAGAGATNRH